MANAASSSTRLDDLQLSEYMGAIEHQFMGEGYYWTLVQSTINGYHAYKVKPLIEVQLPCTCEPDNPYDARAVVCKGLDGDVIGHVPKDLASIFSWFLEKSYADRIVALYTGRIVNEGAVRGGGVKLGSIYMLHNDDVYYVMEMVRMLNKEIPGARADVFLDSFSHMF